MKSMARKVATAATRNGKLRKMLADEIMSSSEHEIYGKFRSTGTELSPGLPAVVQGRGGSLSTVAKLDSLSLSSQDIELFNDASNNSTNTSEYFSLSLNTVNRKGNLRLPEFGQDDILVKPTCINNWILLPTQGGYFLHNSYVHV